MKTVFKRLLIVAVFACMAVVLMGADSQGCSSKTTSGSDTAAPAAADNTVKPGQPITVGDIKWIAGAPEKKAQIESGNEFIPAAKAGGVFVVVPLTAEQVGSTAGTVDPSQIKIVDSKGRSFALSVDGSVIMLVGSDKWILYSQINPNVPKAFTGVFDIPADATGLKLEINSGGVTQRDKGYVDLGL